MTEDQFKLILYELKKIESNTRELREIAELLKAENEFLKNPQ